MISMTQNNSISDRELAISRVINAPRDLVYKMWVSPEHVVKWWGPNGFKTTIKSMEVKNGGHWYFTMHGPDGVDYPNHIKFIEVVPNEKLAYHHCNDDESNPINFDVTVTFKEIGNKTVISMSSIFATKEGKDLVVEKYGAEEGMYQHMDRLAAFSSEQSGDQSKEFVIQRVLNAPRELVFKAWTEKERLEKWWGPKGFKLEVHKLEVKAGGTFLYSMTMNSMIMWGKFVYSEVLPYERLVYLSSFSDSTGGYAPAPMLPIWPKEILNVLTLTEKSGKTHLCLRGLAVNASEAEIAAYEGLFASMEQGFGGTFQMLEDYLVSVVSNRGL